MVFFLLPGFLGLLAYESVAEVPKRETFDKFVAALAITLLSSVIYSFSGAPAGIDTLVATANEHSRVKAIEAMSASLGWTTLIAILLGLASGVLQNKGVVYKCVSALHLGRRTGAIDIWHQVFSRVAPGKWIRLRYADGSVLVGWARYYSEDLEKPGLFVAEATWHIPPTADGGGGTLVPRDVTGPGVLVTSFDDVKAVEIVD